MAGPVPVAPDPTSPHPASTWATGMWSFTAASVAATVALIKETGAELLVNLALPYQDLVLMDACLEAGIHYLDTANYEPEDEAKFEYHWQWAYQERFKEAGLTAILGSGFDPGVTSVFAKWLKKVSKRGYDAMGDINAVAYESLAGYHVVRSFGRETE